MRLSSLASSADVQQGSFSGVPVLDIYSSALPMGVFISIVLLQDEQEKEAKRTERLDKAFCLFISSYMFVVSGVCLNSNLKHSLF